MSTTYQILLRPKTLRFLHKLLYLILLLESIDSCVMTQVKRQQGHELGIYVEAQVVKRAQHIYSLITLP